ncbi:unnamed protein product [Caenorhabditis bovis]|uniref:C3H1-type domain-containing protein n=1 Tax=Caenorhabditis bovis TaxID=2654633 RepID=A0A8S1FF11_9PELO|nr:unnamed protein product [Caenorhabditis bovis]
MVLDVSEVKGTTSEKLNQKAVHVSPNQDKRPPSSLSTGSSDSGVYSSGALVSSHSSQPTEPSSGLQTSPPSPSTQINSLLYQTASLIAVNEQLRKELAEKNDLSFKGVPATTPEQIPPLLPAAPLNTPINTRAPRERRVPKPESYKTVICQAWLESKTCSFAENCRFAHGEEELRPSKLEPCQNKKYKTKLCDKYTTTGLCPYGKRCLFIHPDHGPNAYIRPDKLFEVSQRHALADLRDQMESQILSGNRITVPPPPPPPSSSRLLGRPVTPTEPIAKPPQSVPLGPTPMRGPRFSTNGRSIFEGIRPPSSWPLEPSSFFDNEIPSGNKMSSRPVSPFESMLMGSNMMTMMGKNSTPGGVSGYVSGGSTPYRDLEASPFSPMPTFLNRAHREEDSFSMGPGAFDHLAEDMAKHLELW